MICEIPHRIRPMRTPDLGFCRDAWLRSGCDAPSMRWVPHSIYLRLQAERIERWLARYAEQTFVACAAGEDDILLGFVCAPTPSLVFYLYVKHDMRRMGLARSLWNFVSAGHAPVSVTHWGESCPSISVKHPGLMVFDPSRLEDPRRRQQPNRSRLASQPLVFVSPEPVVPAGL